MSHFTTFIQKTYEEKKTQWPGQDLDQVKKLREHALQVFLQKGLPNKKAEAWRHHPIDQLVEEEYNFQLTPDPYQPVENIFKCRIENISSNMFATLNGWYLHQHAPLTVFPNGVIIGSIFAAMRQYPELVFKHLAQQNLNEADPLVALNEAFFYDGLFVYVPDHVSVDQPLQMVSIVDTSHNLLIQNRNVIVLGKNASLSFIHCNDTIKYGKTFINNVTEVSLGENATLHYYKMENKDADSLLVDHLVVNQKTYSRLLSTTVTFNAGYVRNMVRVNLNEPFADANVYGLYLVDKKQYVDNQVFINHAASDCTSKQHYKGITDDESTANFNGHIFVAKDSQRTAAFQTNGNITLTDSARIMTKPFLEIYADDVQCSHGATVGQLNDEALFYLRSRGICERNSRMLLLYAFANEIVDLVEIESLRSALTDMVKKRLSGELNVCEQCVLHCSDEKVVNFDIDISKI